MKRFYLLACVTAISMYSCKTVEVNEDNFAWKSFDNSELDQSINLNEYASPNMRDGQDTSKIVILCASGGGSRAAAFTIGIMLELERVLNSSDSLKTAPIKNVLNEIDYFSTVSGGGWGVSSYIAYLYQNQKYSNEEYKNAIIQYNSNILSNPKKQIECFPTFNSFEKYLANRADFTYHKYQYRYIYTFRGSKRSDKVMTNRLNMGYLGMSYRKELEAKIKTTPREIVLGDVFKSKGEMATLPMLITNTTNVDNYKLVPFTPDRLHYWGVSGYQHHVKGWRNIPNNDRVSDYNSVPLASGVKASSGIPFLIGASSLPALKKTNSTPTGNKINYYLHLQDGGIIDQQAMHSAKAILNYHKGVTKKENRIVFIVDASSSGIANKKKFKKENAGRFYNLSRVVAPFTTPDAQYALTRERVKLLEDEYNCTVIYLGTEVLLDPALNPYQQNSLDLPKRKKAVEQKFFDYYFDSVQNNPKGFLTLDNNERKLLYSFISNHVPTRFSSWKKTKLSGQYIVDKPESSATIMFLAGRGVVQLKSNEIKRKFSR